MDDVREGRDSAGFSPTVMVVLVLVGVVSLAGLGLLSAYTPELRSGDDGREHALSRSSVGFAAVARLLQKSGEPTVLSRGPLSPAAEDGLLILTLSAQTRPADIEDFEHAGPMLIVLPKWRTTPDPLHRGWVKTDGLQSNKVILNVLPKDIAQGLQFVQRQKGAQPVALHRPDGSAFPSPERISNLQGLISPTWRPVLLDQDGVAVMIHDGRGRYILADPDFLNTAGVKSLAGARTAVAMLDLIRAEDTPVVFDLTLHGFQRSLNPLRLALEPPLLGATLCLALALLLAGLQAGVRFGPARSAGRALALGKRALADNTAALVRLARREHRMAEPYAELVKAEVIKAASLPRGLDEAEAEIVLDRMGQAAGVSQRFKVLVEQARAAQTPGDLLKAARDLYQWRQEMARGRR
ncbi:hypothetical protein [Phenylobacterium sp.]|jgi:hypothetical protein|uniref:hypothetical protein n=1 Tax=Phenylobacterium sp. TaxID=1871053 RepID=UPI0035B2D826